MLRVTIELVPQGDTDAATTIRTIEIGNIGFEAEPDVHLYHVRMANNERGVEHRSQFRKHATFTHARSDGVEVCVKRALEALVRKALEETRG